MKYLIIYPLMIGTTEIVVLGALALLLFGGKKLPGLMKSMGQGVRQFKEGMTEAPEEFQKGMEGQQIEEQRQEPDTKENVVVDVPKENGDREQ